MEYWMKCLRLLHKSRRLRYDEFFRIQLKCIFFVVVSSLSTVVFPSFVSKIIDQGIGARNFTNICLFSFLLMLSGVVMVVANYAYQMSFFKFSQKIVLELKEMVFEKLLKTNINFWSEHSAGDMLKILESDISAIQSMFTRSISTIVSSSFMFLVVAGYLIYLHFTIGVLLIITTLIIIFVQREFGKRLEKIVYPLRDEIGRFTAFSNQVLNNIINIEMVGDTERISKQYICMNKSIIQSSIKQIRMVTVLQNFISSYSIFSLFIVMFIGAKAVIEGSMTVGALVSLTMYTQWLLGPLMSLGIDKKSKYFIDTTIAKSDKERYIKEMIEKYIENKGLKVLESDYIKYGYQPYLTGDDFHSIIKLAEQALDVFLPTYDGISYRTFDNAVTMVRYFEQYS